MTPSGELSLQEEDQDPETQTRTLELYAPTPDQYRCHMSRHQFNVLRFGRQSGKSTWGNNKLMDRTWKVPDSRYWYVGPTYRLAKQMYERAVFALNTGKNAALRDKSDTELMIELLSGGRVYYLSGHDLGGLPGETLDGAMVDECRNQKHMKELWERVLMPMLGTTGGWADFLSTPNGMDYFYELAQKAKTDPDWGSFHAPSTRSPLWTPKMIATAKDTMDEALFAQEILAEFRELGKGSCFYAFGEHNQTSRSPFTVGDQKISPHLPILVGMDFNLHPMCWVLGQHRQTVIHYHDEIYLENSNTPEAADELCERAKGHAPGVLLVGDASGKAGQRAAAGESDYSIIKQKLKEAGIRCEDRTPEANPAIKDRVNAMNAACKAASGSVKLTISPECKRTIKDLLKRKWKENSSSLAFDNSDPMAGHLADAVTYPVSVLNPIKPIGGGTKLVIINR